MGRYPRLVGADISLSELDSRFDPLPPSAISLLALRYSYSINSSALSRIDVGTSRPSALAVVILSTVSYFTDNCTGRSAGFSLLRMRST